jgi:hypothetical protein
MSTMSLPRQDEPTRSVRPGTRHSRPVSLPAPARFPVTSTRSGTRVRRQSPLARALMIFGIAITLVVSGTLYAGHEQVQLHQLQYQLQQEQSKFALSVNHVSALSAPAQITAHASTLHLVPPLTVTQIVAVSLKTPVPFPHFTSPVVRVSRTHR